MKSTWFYLLRCLYKMKSFQIIYFLTCICQTHISCQNTELSQAALQALGFCVFHSNVVSGIPGSYSASKGLCVHFFLYHLFLFVAIEYIYAQHLAVYVCFVLVSILNSFLIQKTSQKNCWSLLLPWLLTSKIKTHVHELCGLFLNKTFL